MPKRMFFVFLAWPLLAELAFAGAEQTPSFNADVLPLLRARCVKCHGPAKREAKLDLSTAGGLAAGGESGAAIDRAAPLGSLLWKRIEAQEMPPDEPLPEAERRVLVQWLSAGAPGLPAQSEADPAEHWAFRRLARPAPPAAAGRDLRTPIDRFLEATLAENGLSFSPEADRYALIRRVSFDLTGLPPSPEEIEEFVSDARPEAYERLVERYLASPHYGQRWGKWWLDAAGYADSNGYFNADSNRPLAYRYRDYVVGAFNADRPFDQFVREQLAGDEIAGYRDGADIEPEQVALLVATHFLRNPQDGTGESDGNPDEVRADRYSVLEGAEQMIGSSLLGLTLQCARCHDHKFEPVTQRDYYALQAILGAAFDPEHWTKPNDRQINTATAAELAAWEARRREIDETITTRRQEFAAWIRQHRPRGEVLFEDHFDAPEQISQHWSDTAPGDDAPAGTPPVALASSTAPAAEVREGTLALLEASNGGNRWLSTRGKFNWAPEAPGASIQVTFDLVADKLASDAPAAARIGYYLALNDYDDSSGQTGGNILIDGNPAGGAQIHIDYPGADARAAGAIGDAHYQPGHNYGVRVTNAGEGRYLLEHLVDSLPEEKTITLDQRDLTPGGFGFEFCCGRSFVVDNVLIESIGAADSSVTAQYRTDYVQKRRELEDAVKQLNARRTDKPGRTAVVVDVSPTPLDWFLLVRGNYGQRGEKVAPDVPQALGEPGNAYVATPLAERSSGRRLALARWLTQPGSRAASLLARVTVNRLWQQHFEVGICATPENLGYSGSPPSHPELLEYLAWQFIEDGWSIKRLHRSVLLSAAYRQSSLPRDDANQIDPANRLLWRYPLRRLDAESVRDAALAIAAELDRAMRGPYIPTHRNADGEIVVDGNQPGARKRSLYLQQRRTQVLSLLEVFDAPSIVVNCTRRQQATIPLQSLSALNSAFFADCARMLAERLKIEGGHDPIGRAFLLVAGREPRDDERSAAERFLKSQPLAYAGGAHAASQALVDLCQMLLASNAFLYVE